MRLRDFIRENRQELDDCIKSVCSNCKLNDEGLYNWAKAEGVRNL